MLNQIIFMLAITIGAIILGIMAFETVFGIPPTGIEIFAIGALVAITWWVKEYV